MGIRINLLNILFFSIGVRLFSLGGEGVIDYRFQADDLKLHFRYNPFDLYGNNSGFYLENDTDFSFNFGDFYIGGFRPPSLFRVSNLDSDFLPFHSGAFVQRGATFFEAPLKGFMLRKNLDLSEDLTSDLFAGAGLYDRDLSFYFSNLLSYRNFQFQGGVSFFYDSEKNISPCTSYYRQKASSVSSYLLNLSGVLSGASNGVEYGAAFTVADDFYMQIPSIRVLPFVFYDVENIEVGLNCDFVFTEFVSDDFRIDYPEYSGNLHLKGCWNINGCGIVPLLDFELLYFDKSENPFMFSSFECKGSFSMLFSGVKFSFLTELAGEYTFNPDTGYDGSLCVMSKIAAVIVKNNFIQINADFSGKVEVESNGKLQWRFNSGLNFRFADSSFFVDFYRDPAFRIDLGLRFSAEELSVKVDEKIKF